VPPSPVRSSDLARYAPDTPQRAVLEWCAAIQRGDKHRAQALGDRRESRRRTSRCDAFRRWTSSARSRARGSTTPGSPVIGQPCSPPSGPRDARRTAASTRTSRPQAFELRRVDNAWRLSYDTDLSSLTPRTGFIAPRPNGELSNGRTSIGTPGTRLSDRPWSCCRRCSTGRPGVPSPISRRSGAHRAQAPRLHRPGDRQLPRLGGSKVLSVQRRGSRAILVTRLGGTPATLSLARGRGRWILERLRYGQRLCPRRPDTSRAGCRFPTPQHATPTRPRVCARPRRATPGY
jgi:hypothetical protein